MKIALLTIIGLFTLAIGASAVYAIEQTVDVPFDNWLTSGCQLQTNGDYMCLWVPSEESTFTAPSTEEDETDDEKDDTDGTVDVPKSEEKLTREERDIQRMIDKITLDLQKNPDAVPDADKQLLIILKRAQDECKFGIEEGQPIQTYQVFAIPKGYFYPEDTDFAKYNMLGKLVKLVEACSKWDTYKTKWLGPQYKEIQEADERAIEDAKERILVRDTFAKEWMTSQNITITDEFMNKAISEHDKIEEVEDAFKDFCTSKNFGNATKLLYGCNVTLPDNQGGFTDTSENPVWKKLQQYKSDPENAVGEPRYNISTNPKCAILSSYITQYELSEEAGNTMLEAAGCKI